MVPYASVMISVDRDPTAEDRIRVSDALAERFGARLIGVAAAPAFALPYGGMAGYAKAVEQERREVEDGLEEARSLFERTVRPDTETNWRSDMADPLHFLTLQSRAADLVVIGRHGPDDAFDRRFSVAAGDLLMSLGRPVLLVPPRVNHVSTSRVVVAWKDTPEARRSVLDALPLLRTAEEVIIVAIRENEGQPEAADDVAAYLGRHGTARTRVLTPALTTSVADALTRAPRQEGAGIIVAGAYGHSRLREWIFGGVTRSLLDGASLCCLLSR